MTEDDKLQLLENTRLTREIHGALVGHLGQPGLLHEHRELKSTVASLSQRIWLASGVISGLGMAWEMAKFVFGK